MIWTCSVRLHMLAGWRERDPLMLGFFSGHFASGAVYLPIPPPVQYTHLFFSFYISHLLCSLWLWDSSLVVSFIFVLVVLSFLPSAPNGIFSSFFLFIVRFPRDSFCFVYVFKACVLCSSVTAFCAF